MNILHPKYQDCNRLYPAEYVEFIYKDCSLPICPTSSITISAQCVYRACCITPVTSLITNHYSRVCTEATALVSSGIMTYYYNVLKYLSTNIATIITYIFAPSVATFRELSFLISDTSHISYRASRTLSFVVMKMTSLGSSFQTTLVAMSSLIVFQASQSIFMSLVIKTFRLTEFLHSFVDYIIPNVIWAVRQVFAPLSIVGFGQSIIYRPTAHISTVLASFIHICRVRIFSLASQIVTHIYTASFAWRTRLVYTSIIKHVLNMVSRMEGLYDKEA